MLNAETRLNVTAILISGVTAAAGPDLVGADYVDADGVRYLPWLRQPVPVFEASAAKLTTAHERARRRDVTHAICTRDLLATGHDEATAPPSAPSPRPTSTLVGLALRAPHRDADAVLRGLPRHRWAPPALGFGDTSDGARRAELGAVWVH